MKKDGASRETFLRIIWTLVDQLRRSADITSCLWLTGMALLAKCIADSKALIQGQNATRNALQSFLEGSPMDARQNFKTLLNVMSEGDEDLTGAIKVLSDRLIDQMNHEDLGIVRNALVHTQFPTMTDPEIQMELGDAFVDSILRLQGREVGEHIIPRPLGQLIVQLANPALDEKVVVPFAGLGSLLVEARRLEFGQNSDRMPVPRIGLVRDTETWARGVVLLRIYGISGFRAKTFITAKSDNETADVLMSCPPFGMVDKEAIQAMRFAIPKIAGDMPDQALRDFAGVFQIMQSLGPKGRAVVVVNPGLLFRVGAVARLRADWVNEDSLEAVISLPPGLMHNTAMATNIVIFNMNKPAQRGGLVLFIAADEMGRTKGSKKLDVDLFQEEMAKIVSAYQVFKDVPGLAKVIDGFELGDQDWNLIPARYVVSDEDPESGPDLKALHASLAVTEGQAAQVRTHLDQAINQLLTSL